MSQNSLSLRAVSIHISCFDDTFHSIGFVHVCLRVDRCNIREVIPDLQPISWHEIFLKRDNICFADSFVSKDNESPLRNEEIRERGCRDRVFRLGVETVASKGVSQSSIIIPR